MNKSCETFWLFKKVIMRDIHANTHLSPKKIKVVGTYVKSVLVFSRDVAQETCLLNFLSRILRLWRNFWRKLVWETDEVFGVSSRRFPLADWHQFMLIITFCNTSSASELHLFCSTQSRKCLDARGAYLRRKSPTVLTWGPRQRLRSQLQLAPTCHRFFCKP